MQQQSPPQPMGNEHKPIQLAKKKKKVHSYSVEEKLMKMKL